MRKLLLLFSVCLAFQMPAFAQFNFNNDTCESANLLCAGLLPGKGLTTVNRGPDSVPGMDCITPGRGVWFYMEGQITGGSVSVNVSGVDSTNCGMEMQVFRSAGACGTLDTAGMGCVYDFTPGGPGFPANFMSVTFTVDAGVRYYILINSLPGCTNGETFIISANTNGVGIDAVNDSSVLGIPVPDLGFVVLDPCDTSVIRLLNNSRPKGGNTSYFIDTLGSGNYTQWTILEGEDDTLFYSPCNTYQPRLVACNECYETCDASAAPLLPGDDVTVPSAAIIPTVDTVFPGCVGSPMGFEVQANMNGDVLGNPVPDIDKFILTVSQDCGAGLDTVIFIIGQQTSPVGEPLPDTISTSPLTIIVDTIINPNLEFINGQDTIYDFNNGSEFYFIPCTDIINTHLKVEGFCNKPGGCPDTVQNVFQLEPPMLPVMIDTVTFCVDDPFQFCVTLDTINGGGFEPFTYTWYDSIVDPGQLIRTFGPDDTIADCASKDDMLTIRDLRSFHPEDIRDGTFRYIVRIEDSRGCVVFDTTYLNLCKPVVDTMYIANLGDLLRTCDPDPNASVICTETPPDVAYCPGDTVQFHYEVRAKPPFTLEFVDTTAGWTPIAGLSSQITTVAGVDSVVDTAFIHDRTKQADFTIAIIATDSLGCMDTNFLCIPIHEPPTFALPAVCLGDSDTIAACVIGACPGSRYFWDATLAPHDTLLEPMNADSSCVWFNYHKLGLPDSLLQGVTFDFTVIVFDAVTGCIDTVNTSYLFDNPIEVFINPMDTTICFGDTIPLILEGDTAGGTFTWFQADTIPIPPFPNSPMIMVSPNDTTEYKVFAVRGACDWLDSTMVNVLPPPQIDSLQFSPADTLCDCDTATLAIFMADPTNLVFNWTRDSLVNDILDPTNDTTRVTVCASDTFRVTITDTTVGCSIDTFIPMVSIPLPVAVVNVTGQDSQCIVAGDSTMWLLDGRASSVDTLISYQWTSNFSPPDVVIADPTADSTSAMVYITDAMVVFCLTVTDTSNGNSASCDSTVCDTIYIFEPPVIQNLVMSTSTGTDTVCECETVRLAVFLDDLTNRVITWTSDSGNVFSDTTAFITEAIACNSDTFRFTITDTMNNCTNDSMVWVTVNPRPIPAIDSLFAQGTGKDTICLSGGNDTVRLFGSAMGTDLIYQWTSVPPVQFGDSSAPITFAITDTFTIFTLTVTDTLVDCDSSFTDTLHTFFRPLLVPDANSYCSADTDKIDTIRIIGTAGDVSDTVGLNSFFPNNNLLTKLNDTTWTADVNFVPAPDTVVFGITVTNVSTGCVDTITANVIILDTITLMVVPPQDTICQFDSVQLNGSGAVNYTWTSTPADPTLIPPMDTEDTVMLVPPVVGGVPTLYNYKVVATVGGCIDSIDTIFVLVNPLPVISAGPDDTICIFDTIQIGGGPTGHASFTYAWVPAGSLDDSTLADPTAFPDTTTPYRVTVIDTNTCVNTDTTVVLVNPLPIVSAGADDTICAGDTTVIGGAPTGPAGSEYAWSPNLFLNDSTLANPEANPDSTRTYVVTVTDINGCINTDTITIVVNQLANVVAHTQPEDTTCDAGPLSTLVLDDTITGVSPFVISWSPLANLNDSTIEDPTFTAPDTGTFTYILTVTDSNLCVNQDTVVIVVVDSPTISNLTVTADDSVCIDEPITLEADFTSIDRVTWEAIPNPGTFNIIRDDSVEYTPSVGFLGTIKFRVTAENNGCGSVMDSVDVAWFPIPIVDGNAASTADTICENTCVSLDGDSTNALRVMWSEAPGGPGGLFDGLDTVFTDTATYCPPVGFSGLVSLYFDVIGLGTCDTARDTIDVFVQANPVANVGAGPYGPICKDDTLDITGTAANGLITWDDDGLGGVFVPATGNSVRYAPPLGFDGTINIRQTVTSPFDSCGFVMDSFSLDVTDSTTVEILLPTQDTTVCEGSVINLTATTFNSTVVGWTANGGNFAPPNALVTTWTPPAGGGNYVLYITSENTGTPCPAVVDSITVTVIALPTADAGGTGNDRICKDDCHPITGDGQNGTISWDDGGVGGTFTPPTSNNTTYCPPTGYSGPVTITQTVTSTFAPCGDATDAFTLTVHDSTTVGILTADTTICDGSTITLRGTATNQSGVTWVSDRPAITPNANSLTTDFTPDDGFGVYTLTLTATNANPCPDEQDVITVTVLQNPAVTAAVDKTEGCQGESVQLTASTNGGVDGIIVWDDGGAGGTFVPSVNDSTPEYVPNTAIDSFTVVTLKVTAFSTTCGMDSDFVSVTYHPIPPVNIVTDPGEVCGSNPVTLKVEGADLYQWVMSPDTLDTFPDPATAVDTVFFVPTEITEVTVIGIDATTGCSGIDALTIPVRPNPQPTAYADYLEGECYPLDVDFSFDYADFGITPDDAGVTISSILWRFGDDSLATSASPRHIYREARDSTYPVVYQVILRVSYDNGCEAYDTVHVDVCEGFVLPNVFTPNGDGVNDFFFVRGLDDRDCDLVVFDRWGDKVYEKEQYNGEWGGKDMDGNDLNPDTYYYVLKCADKSTYTGFVKIIRAK